MGIRYPQPKYAIRNVNTLSATRIRYPQRECAISNRIPYPQWECTPDVHVNTKWADRNDKSENDLLGHHTEATVINELSTTRLDTVFHIERTLYVVQRSFAAFGSSGSSDIVAYTLFTLYVYGHVIVM